MCEFYFVGVVVVTPLCDKKNISLNSTIFFRIDIDVSDSVLYYILAADENTFHTFHFKQYSITLPLSACVCHGFCVLRNGSTKKVLFTLIKYSEL